MVKDPPMEEVVLDLLGVTILGPHTCCSYMVGSEPGAKRHNLTLKGHMLS